MAITRDTKISMHSCWGLRCPGIFTAAQDVWTYSPGTELSTCLDIYWEPKCPGKFSGAQAVRTQQAQKMSGHILLGPKMSRHIYWGLVTYALQPEMSRHSHWAPKCMDIFTGAQDVWTLSVSLKMSGLFTGSKDVWTFTGKQDVHA